MDTSVIIIIIVVVGFIFLQGYISIKTNPKKDMFCIYSDDNELLIKVKLELEKVKIFYTNLGWTPTQTSFNTPGNADKTPGEIWILKKDLLIAKELIQSKFMVEQTEHAIVVTGNLNR